MGEGELEHPSPLMGEGKGGGDKRLEPHSPPVHPEVSKGEKGETGKTVIVQEGDTLERLARRVYGSVDEKILAFVQEHNPAILDMDFIRTGWEIHFPPLPETEE